jgi:hypothetical protein
MKKATLGIALCLNTGFYAVKIHSCHPLILPWLVAIGTPHSLDESLAIQTIEVLAPQRTLHFSII